MEARFAPRKGGVHANPRRAAVGGSALNLLTGLIAPEAERSDPPGEVLTFMERATVGLPTG